MKIGSLFLVLMTAWPALSSAQTDAERRSWLESNVSPVRSLDFSDTNYADLAAIGRAIGNRRVVLLGEQGHGDGTTFEAKARVIRYLHEKLGFDLLVFESGFYDCRRTWQDVRSGLALADSAANCMFELWSNSRQLRPLLEYVDAKRSTSRPVSSRAWTFNRPAGVPNC